MTGFYNHDTPPINIPIWFYKQPKGCLSHECNDPLQPWASWQIWRTAGSLRSWFKVYSIQIPYHRLPFWYNFEYSLLKTIGLFQFDFHHSFWSICIRIPWRIWADLCMIFYLPLSTEMRSICIHAMNDFSFLWCLCRACIFASRVTFFGGFSDFKLRG